MSISDQIVVMKDGLIQQIGQPQQVYDDPVNLFVAKFLGTPPINVFEGSIRSGQLYIGRNAVLPAEGIPDQEVFAAIRPEGFIPDENGPLSCTLNGIEVMGRDISIISSHECAASPAIRSIIAAENKIDATASEVRFCLKPTKVFLFSKKSQERIYLS